MNPGFYSNKMLYSYWNQCSNYFGWGADPCRLQKKACTKNCVAMCERSHEFGIPSFVLHVYGCNLRCKFCWSESIYKSEKIKKTPLEVVNDLRCKLSQLNSDKWILQNARTKPDRIKCIRITGHEPTLQWNHLLEFLKILNTQEEFSGFRINIQTNGIEAGKPDPQLDLSGLREFGNLHLRVEISFKGVNPEQFHWLADRPSSLFDYQCQGFERFWGMKHRNLEVVAELGINHCKNLRSKKFNDLGVYIIDRSGKIIDFSDFSNSFKDKVLSNITLWASDDNEFQEFSGINKDRAREVIATYSKISKNIKKKCLPSEYS